MTQARFYSSVAAKTALTGSVAAGGTTLAVAATTGFPASLPFTLILERDTANEEVVTVTAVSSLTLTVARAQDGTTGVSHATGAVVEHGVSARDFSEPQAHIAATGAVHGLTGSIVGTTDVQILSGKTLTSPTINGGVADATSTIGGVSGTTLAADRTAWTAWAPTLPAGWTLQSAAYRLVGKSLFLRVYATFAGTASATYGGFLTLPLSKTSATLQAVTGYSGQTTSIVALQCFAGSGSVDLQLPPTGGANVAFNVNGAIEVN